MNTTLIAVLAVVYLGVIAVSVYLLRVFSTSARPDAAPAAPREESPSLKYLKERCAMLEQRDVQRRLYLEMTTVISGAPTFDEMARGSVDAVCRVLEAPYGALLWKTPDGQKLEFVYRRGYPSNPGFHLPVSASIAGSVITRREPVFVDNPKGSITYVPIPGITELNLLCTPVRMFNDQRFILRVAGINTSRLHSAEVIPTFKLLAPLISSALEKALISQQNLQRKQELEAIAAISQTLNHTLDCDGICAESAKHLGAVFSALRVFFVRGVPSGGPELFAYSPGDGELTPHPDSTRIMLRNLLEDSSPRLVEDVRTDPLFKGVTPSVRSYMQMPVRCKEELFAMLCVITAPEHALKREELVILDALAQQVGITLERAVWFGQQEELAMRDGLTGLLNHRVFLERLAQEQQRLARYKRPYSVLLLDIDHFKKFNDTYGHQTGDIVLKSVADSLASACRNTDMAFRYGGEEFCMILPETSLENASIFAQRLNVRIRTTRVSTPNGELGVTVSIGVAEGNESVAPEKLIEAADKALYRAKESGRDRVCLFRLAPARKSDGARTQT